MFPCEFCKILKNAFLQNTSGWLLLYTINNFLRKQHYVLNCWFRNILEQNMSIDKSTCYIMFECHIVCFQKNNVLQISPNTCNACLSFTFQYRWFVKNMLFSLLSGHTEMIRCVKPHTDNGWDDIWYTALSTRCSVTDHTTKIKWT